MYLNQFPDIQWLRANAAKGFEAGKDAFGNKIPSGWPNVILHTKTTHTERDNIKGPFSLFVNLSGKSMVKVDRHWHQVNDTFYCTSNRDEVYNLHIPEAHTTETFNIHFGASLYEDVSHVLSQKNESLLENMVPSHPCDLKFLPKTQLISNKLMTQIRSLISYREKSGLDYSPDMEFEICSLILEEILKERLTISTYQHRLDTKKSSTKKEIFKRINLGIDFIHDHVNHSVDLEQICQEIGLSKFHFIRAFKTIYGLTPMAYIAQMKVVQAKRLLRNSNLSINEVALRMGFSEHSAFTRFMKRNTGYSPNSFRN